MKRKRSHEAQSLSSSSPAKRSRSRSKSKRQVVFSGVSSVARFDKNQAPKLLQKLNANSTAGGASSLAIRERVRLSLSCEASNTAHELEQRGARVFTEEELDRLVQGEEVRAARL
jgi:hypothetical protein